MISHRLSTTPTRRLGSTLTEVLVALMIMSIGLVSLATLFPLATLRAAKAVQVTAATDLRYIADAQLTMYPQMITDPDLTPQTSNLPGFNQLSLNWVIDPIGYSNAAGLPKPLDVNKMAFADFYGHDGASASPFIRRYSFNRGSVGLANDFAGLPDTVNILAEKPLTGEIGGATEITFAPGVLSTFGIGVDGNGRPLTTTRITFFSADGRTSQSRDVTLVDPSKNRLVWSEDINGNDALDAGEDVNLNGGLDRHPLPANFVVTSIRVESPEIRYSWLLTVRRVNSGLAEVDVVVFFRRPPADPTDPRSDEQIYPVVTLVGNTQQPGFLQAKDLIRVQYSGARPAVRKGGFLFDLGNARWYRITNVVADNGSQIDLTIDPPAIVSSPRDNQGNVIGDLAMFPRGVVEVFSLGTRP